MDQFIDDFLIEEDFSPSISTISVSDETIQKFKNSLPDKLLNYWEYLGFSGFGEGVFWIVNPLDYQDILDRWLQKTNLWGREKFFVVARTAFGELYVRGDKSYKTTIIDPHLNNILPGDPLNEGFDIEKWERSIGIFFSTKTKKNTDYFDRNEKPLFQRCLKKYGMLEHDEMYTFSTALALGGAADINNIKKVKILEQLSMLCDLDTPVVLPSPSELFGSI